MNEALVLLVLLWAVLLVPSALRSRSSTSPHVTVGGFERAMDVLKASPSSTTSGKRQMLVPRDAGRIVEHAGAATGRGLDDAPPPRVSAQREDPTVASRRLWFTRLLAGTAVSLVAAVIVGGLVWLVAAAAVAGTAGYATLLRRWKLQRDEVRSVVRQLTPERAAEERAPVAVAVGESRASGTVRLRSWEG